MLNIGSQVTHPSHTVPLFVLGLCEWRPAWLVQRCFRICGRDPAGKGSGRSWIRGMLWVCERQPVPGKYEPHGELFFLIEKKPFALTKAVEIRPCVTAVCT